MTRYQFIDGAFAAIGLRLQEGDCTRYIALESDIQQSVFGRVTEIYLTLEKDQPLPILSLSQAIWERDVKIAIISQVIRERDEQIANLNMKVAIISQVIRERDEQIANLNQSIVERDAKIAERDG
jgi:uncharacterized protein (DUF3084 family)